MNTLHPYAPDVQWRFAVARRFRVPEVESLYREVILPVISSQGLVVECSYASDSPRYPDFWTNRMKLILLSSDIHILIDIEPSASTEFEFQQSKHLVRKGSISAFAVNLGWRPKILRTLFAPTSITITSRPSREGFSGWQRSGVIRYSQKSDVDDLQLRLRRQVERAKTSRIARIKRSEKWGERFARWTKVPYADTRQTMITSMRVSKQLAEGATIDQIRSNFTAIRGESGYPFKSFPVSEINQIDQWNVNLRKGQERLPSRFADSVSEVKAKMFRPLTILLGDDLSKNKYTNKVIKVLAVLTALKMRKLGKERLKDH